MKEIDLKHDLFGNIRSFTENDQIYFVASDVAKALGYATPQKAIYDHCQENVQINGTPNRNTLNLKDANGRPHDYRIIDEPNLYRLIFGSTIESAKDFTEWVFTEVLPSIRKYGSYPEPDLSHKIKHEQNKVIVTHHYFPVNEYGIENGYRNKIGTTGKTATIDVNYRNIKGDEDLT